MIFLNVFFFYICSCVQLRPVHQPDILSSVRRCCAITRNPNGLFRDSALDYIIFIINIIISVLVYTPTHGRPTTAVGIITQPGVLQ